MFRYSRLTRARNLNRPGIGNPRLKGPGMSQQHRPTPFSPIGFPATGVGVYLKREAGRIDYSGKTNDEGLTEIPDSTAVSR